MCMDCDVSGLPKRIIEEMVAEQIDAAAEAIRNVVWVPGCAPDDPKTWAEISDDAKFTWRAAARAAIEAFNR